MFTKGYTPWNKGLTGVKTNSKGRVSPFKGIKGIFKANITTFKKGMIPWNKGKKFLELSGNNHHLFGKHWKLTEEQKANRKGTRTREQNGMWIADRSKLVKSEKKHLDGRYREWMFGVKKIDNWKCKINNSACDGRLEAHHILNWIDYPELRYDINNGITLRHAHHPRGRKREAELSPYLQQLVAERK